MVIEHVFVTTMESSRALQLAADYLLQRGFTQAGDSAFPIGGEWTVLEMNRGRKTAARAKNIRELPQVARIELDRGKVTVALSIGVNAAWGGGGFATVSEKPSKMELHKKLLHTVAVGLEQLLAHNGSGKADYAAWDAVEQEIDRVARKRRNRTLIIGGSIISLLLILLIVAVVAASK